MFHYTIYDENTHEIVGHGKCSEDYLPEGIPCVRGHFDKATHRIDPDTGPYELTPGEVERLARDSALESLREQRDSLLSRTDKALTPDAPTDKKAWMAYRQQLRDLPSKTPDPHNVTWPTPPDEKWIR